MGDPNLPAFGAEFEYTPEMVEELKRSKADILYFASNYFYIIDPDQGRTVIKLYKFQKHILKALTNNRYNILISARQASKTTLFTIFALWTACFNNDQHIVVVANKEATAKEIFRRFKLAYEELPVWLKPAIKEYAQTSATFANGTRVSISTTTGSAARGSTVNCVDGSSLITIRNKKTKQIETLPIKDFYNRLEATNNPLSVILQFR